MLQGVNSCEASLFRKHTIYYYLNIGKYFRTYISVWFSFGQHLTLFIEVKTKSKNRKNKTFYSTCLYGLYGMS